MPWVKGQSGNLNGRPRIDEVLRLRRSLRNLSTRAIERLSELMGSDNDAVSLKAVEVVLAYSLGKPAEQGAADATVSLSYSPDQLAAAEAQLGNGESTAPSEAAATDTGGGPREA